MYQALESTSNHRWSFSDEFWRGLVSALAGVIVIGLLVLVITLSS